ncbi:MAG: hypothetical protein KJ939_00840 [Nanoarchaeota archaeon]|nr:hypothetical protein [Nanoarchaeota archaeon]
MVGNKNSGRPGGNPDIVKISKLYSTGPKSFQGKFISSQNALKHGDFSKHHSLGGQFCCHCEAKEICPYYLKNYNGCKCLESYNQLKKVKVKSPAKKKIYSFELSYLSSIVFELEMAICGLPSSYSRKIMKKQLQMLS